MNAPNITAEVDATARAPQGDHPAAQVPIFAQTLRAIVADLEELVMPALPVGSRGLDSAKMIAGILAHLAEDAQADGPATATVAAELARLEQDDETIAASHAAMPERLAAVETVLTVDHARRLVSTALADGRTVESCDRFPGGFSKDTFFIGTRLPDGAHEDLVLRRDLPFGPAGTTVLDESRLLAKLWERGFPVAEPLWSGNESSVGSPTLLSRRVMGRSRSTTAEIDPADAEQACLDLARILARLHALSPTDILPQAATDPQAALRDYIESWRNRWHRYAIEPSPTLATGFDWLLANIPRDIERAVIVHGDVGFHNILIDKGHVAAVLDWEFFHVSDPVEDLGYCRTEVERMMAWDRFLGAYREAGGGAYLAENAAFFELWRPLRNAVCCASSWHGFLSGAYPALKMAYQGVPLYRMFVRQAGELLRARL